MAKTNAERQALFRERQKERLGLEAYKEKEKERLQKYKYPTKPREKIIENVEYPEKNIDINDIKPLKKRICPINKSDLCENTIKKYTNEIKKLYKLFTDKELTDDNDIIKCINNQPFKAKNIKDDFYFLFDNEYLNIILNTISRNEINSLYCIITRIRGFTPIVKKLYPLIIKHNKEYEIRRSSRSIPDNILNSVSFNPSDVIDKVNKVSLTRTQKLIIYLMLLIPIRRAGDYEITKNAKSQPDDKIDKNYNYYYDKKIYIYNTKNKKEIIFELPNEIVELIDTNDEYMVGKKYTQNYLSRCISDLMKKIYGHQLTSGIIRIMYATYLRTLNLSAVEWKKKCDLMGHTLEENIAYSITN